MKCENWRDIYVLPAVAKIIANRRRGILEKIIAIIKAIYDGSKCHVLNGDKFFDDFEVQSGVRQSCILSPILVLLVIGDVLRIALAGNGGIRWPLKTYLKHLNYADYLCLLSHKIMDLHQMATKVDREAAIVGLKINTGKTKMLSLENSRSSISIDIAQ